MVVWDRTPTPGPVEDSAITHFDFLNLTNGNPDDTWTDADFVQLEGIITPNLTAYATLWHPSTVLDQYRWYKLGPGIPTPNPPVRITEVNVPGTSSATRLPPQCSATITDRSGVRLEWGRKYIPLDNSGALVAGTGRLSTTVVDLLAQQADSLYSAAAAADFLPVVYGKARQKTYSIESVQVDDVVDIIRRRRWDAPVYKVRIPAGG